MRFDFPRLYVLERSYVMLGSGLEADMVEIGCFQDQGMQHFAEHRTVDFTVIGLRGSIDPADVEDVCDVGELGELGFGVLGIGDVTLNVLDPMLGVPMRPWATSHPVNFPWTARGVG